MKKQLKLEHLAPYLPYGLKCQGKKHLERYGLVPVLYVNGLSENPRNVWQYEFLHNDGDLTFADINNKNFKPILRPLSDLTKYGKDIINEHFINKLIEEKHNLDYGMFSHYRGELSIEIDGDPCQSYDLDKSISFNVFETIRNELLRGHFDVFGLIEKGLAIDINKLKQE